MKYRIEWSADLFGSTTVDADSEEQAVDQLGSNPCGRKWKMGRAAGVGHRRVGHRRGPGIFRSRRVRGASKEPTCAADRMEQLAAGLTEEETYRLLDILVQKPYIRIPGGWWARESVEKYFKELTGRELTDEDWDENSALLKPNQAFLPTGKAGIGMRKKKRRRKMDELVAMRAGAVEMSMRRNWLD